MNKLLPLLIVFIGLALFYGGLKASLAAFKADAFRGGEAHGTRLADVNVGAVASQVGPGAGVASHEGLGRYGWNALDNSVISATKFCHHDYDCASNRCSALGVCV